MPKYTVNIVTDITASAAVEIEAESPEEAADLATLEEHRCAANWEPCMENYIHDADAVSVTNSDGDIVWQQGD